ncbi:MAG: CRISPR-associated protein Cas4 [Ardenticatenia bacterium]|nr:CRISPR-associated protein Cas4 [Ardenticatenia bacterium]
MVWLAVMCVGAGVALLLWGERARRNAGLPAGRVVGRDMAGRCEQTSSPLLVAAHLGLSGRPDYVVRVGRAEVPVEVKPHRRAGRPYESDMIQLMAYCLLLEETTGMPPPYGTLVYAHARWDVPYTPESRREVLSVVAEARAALGAPDVPRSHNHPARCRACQVRHACDEALA